MKFSTWHLLLLISVFTAINFQSTLSQQIVIEILQNAKLISNNKLLENLKPSKNIKNSK